MSPKEKAVVERKIETSQKLTWSTVASLAAGIVTSIMAWASLTSMKESTNFINKLNITEWWPSIGEAIIAVVLTVFVSIIWLFISKRKKK